MVLFTGVTLLCLKPVTESFASITSDSRNVAVTDRAGNPLSITYQTAWNTSDFTPLYNVPTLLKDAFVFSEDRKFFDHAGVDWKARAAALTQNFKSGHTVRGASTMTEQVVRMINPRPRNLWSKWLEGWEAMLLERKVSKIAILEFYINQVPYAGHRRGVAQAARYYFDRDLETLSPKEMLALVVLARAPSAYDLYKNPGAIDAPLARLASGLKHNQKISADLYTDIHAETLATQKPSLPVDARHFARFVAQQNPKAIIRTTLDSSLQSQVQHILDARLKKLNGKNVNNAAALIIDHENGNILAWVVGGAADAATPGRDIDAVLVPRQPGSTLKPFLYAMALEKKWTAATLINDAPIAEAVGGGLHRFRNYSNTHYGPITLREALGNSLNIPAILTINYVGVDPFLSRLHALGFESLTRGSQIYDEGLALGNGEVTLYELTRAYSALAKAGQYRDLSYAMNDNAPRVARTIYSPEVASLIGNILSDPAARSIEFGRSSILNFPIRTAAKTGTSTDYRDAWAIGYNDRYTVGIWMGNLDRTPMKEITGSTGPATSLRSIFQVLNKDRDTKRLYLSPALVEHKTCTRPVENDGTCPRRSEWFIAGTESSNGTPLVKTSRKMELVRPTNGLMVAYDPRIPPSHQKFRFEIAGLQPGDTTLWTLNGAPLDGGADGSLLWPVARGTYKLTVTVQPIDGAAMPLDPVEFVVK